MPPLRLGVIGCGDWSSQMHLPALVKLTGRREAACVAVCDLDEPRARQYATRLADQTGQPLPAVHADAENMLASGELDGAFVLVSPAVSPVVISRVASHCIPFLTEKPPATDTVTHQRLVEQVGDLVHVVGYNRRHSPYVVQAKRWMEGITPQSVTCLFSRHERREPDFTTTAVHAIDTVCHLAGGSVATVRVEAAPAGQAINYFVSGWTRGGSRIDILMTPDTASAVEHYIVRAAPRTAVVSFPQRGMMDAPGFVELHEKNRVVARLGPEDWEIDANDFPTLGGILAEQVSFCQAVRGQARPVSTLANTVHTQVIREGLWRLLRQGGRGVVELDLCAY